MEQRKRHNPSRPSPLPDTPTLRGQGSGWQHFCFFKQTLCHLTSPTTFQVFCVWISSNLRCPFPPHSGSRDITKYPTVNGVNGSNFSFLTHILQSVGPCPDSAGRCLHMWRSHVELHFRWFGPVVGYIHLTPNPLLYVTPRSIFIWVLEVVQTFVIGIDHLCA